MRCVVTSVIVSCVLTSGGQLIITQEMIRTGARGYADGKEIGFLDPPSFC